MALFVFLAMTRELLSIEAVLEEPTAYHLRQITIEGTLRQAHNLPSYFAKSGNQCFGAQVLLVDDGTGALEVLVPGVCGNPLAAQPMSEGERVRVRVVIDAQDASEKLHLLEGQRLMGSERAHGTANFVERLGQ